ncbi:MAG TPA: low specificity L-threonine aldolase [Casimicrobiaceae bacterium]|nr:low specificity L-threonine aldolase [Casimicrobiaceae bacterium]
MSLSLAASVLLDADAPQFASDNNAGICPEAWQALADANAGHAAGYGDDRWTREAEDAVRAAFDSDAPVYFVFNGTAANSLALAAMCRNTDAVICHAFAHINVDECGAPEFFSGGAKLLTVDTPHAKLTCDAITSRAGVLHGEHASRPRGVSVTQATELGAIYAPTELRALTEHAHALGLKVHMDGARFANAVAALGCAPAHIANRVGVDVLSLGGTKNGLPFGEALVFFDHALADEFARRRKQGAQLASKMRFLAAPWTAMLRSGAWLRHAAHANAMARRMADAIARVPGATFIAPTEANGVFVHLPPPVIRGLETRGWRFYVFVGDTGCRFMCAWDTPPAAVDRFCADLRELAAGP